MRLIRLNTKDTNLFFNNSIQEDIKLSPSSKIALVNMNFEKEEKQLIIDGTNSKLTNTYDTLTYENDLPDNTITRNNFRELFYSLDYTLQEKVAIKEFADPYVPKSIGLLYNTRFSSDNLTVIETDQQPLINPLQLAIDTPDNSFYKESGFSVTNPGFYKADDGSNALMYSTSSDFPTSTDTSTTTSYQGTKRCCVFTLSLHDLTAATVGGRFGIAPNPSASDMTNINSFLFGIEWTNTGTFYTFKDNAGSAPLAFTPNNDDFLMFAFSNNRVEFRYFSGANPDGIVLMERLFITDDVLFPCISLNDPTGVDACTISNVSIIPNVEAGELESSFPRVQYNTAYNVPTQDLGNVNWDLELSQDVADFLGFSSNSKEVFAANFQWRAVNQLSLYDNSESYIVELLNLDLKSYDGLKEKRKNILMLCPNGRTRNDPDVVYNATFPVLLNLNNAYESFLRNFQARILTDDYKPVRSRGSANITLIIED